jgi:uncharacterized membrane protein YcaP (DUF421 family)
MPSGVIERNPLFNNPSSIFHTLVIGSLAYLVVIALLRISGKRTLSKWNAFDFVVTIAYGSILATLVLSQETSLLQGAIGLGVLLFLQYGLTWIAVRSPLVQHWIKSQPTLLLYRGELQLDALKRERVTQGEIRAAVRAKGLSAIEDVEAIVLETDGSFSVIERLNPRADSALSDVQGYSPVFVETQ